MVTSFAGGDGIHVYIQFIKCVTNGLHSHCVFPDPKYADSRNKIKNLRIMFSFMVDEWRIG